VVSVANFVTLAFKALNLQEASSYFVTWKNTNRVEFKIRGPQILRPNSEGRLEWYALMHITVSRRGYWTDSALTALYYRDQG